MFTNSIFVSLFATAAVYAAKTDLAGCTLTSVELLTKIVTTTAPNGQVGSFGDYTLTRFMWNGQEQCQLLDCGGGRAPPKSNVPGCPLYTGTDTVPSIPFPTASLTLDTAAAAASSTAAPSASPAASAPASPAATSAPGSTSVAASTDPSSPAASPPSSSDAPSPTVVPDNASGSTTAADLNPSSPPSNGAVAAATGPKGVLLGLAAAVLGLL